MLITEHRERAVCPELITSPLIGVLLDFQGWDFLHWPISSSWGILSSSFPVLTYILSYQLNFPFGMPLLSHNSRIKTPKLTEHHHICEAGILWRWWWAHLDPNSVVSLLCHLTLERSVVKTQNKPHIWFAGVNSGLFPWSHSQVLPSMVSRKVIFVSQWWLLKVLWLTVTTLIIQFGSPGCWSGRKCPMDRSCNYFGKTQSMGSDWPRPGTFTWFHFKWIKCE